MGPSGRATAAADGEGAVLPRLVLGWPARHGQHVYYHVLTPGGVGAYDAGGVSARCVVAHPTDPLRLLMLYEALKETKKRHGRMPSA